MKIGGLAPGASRREERKEKEAEARRAEEDAKRWTVSREVKPAELRGGRAAPVDDLVPVKPIKDRGLLGLKSLPKQKVLFAANLKLLKHVDLVVHGERLELGADVRRTVIMDIDKNGRLYLTQTSPPMLRSQVGTAVELSFLSQFDDVPGGRWLRVGYSTTVADILFGYPEGRDSQEAVIVVEGPKELRPNSVRQAYRVAPPSDLDMRMVLWPDGTRVGILDISETGAGFYHSTQWAFDAGHPMQLAILSGRLTLILDCRVVRSNTIKSRAGLTYGLTGVAFENLEPDTKSKLNQLLSGILRHIQIKRSGIDQNHS